METLARRYRLRRGSPNIQFDFKTGEMEPSGHGRTGLVHDGTERVSGGQALKLVDMTANALGP